MPRQKIYTAADDSFLAEMISLAGGDPITTGSTTNFEIPLETLVTADPELILLGDAAYGTTADAVRARNGWAGMTAREDRRDRGRGRRDHQPVRAAPGRRAAGARPRDPSRRRRAHASSRGFTITGRTGRTGLVGAMRGASNRP